MKAPDVGEMPRDVYAVLLMHDGAIVAECPGNKCKRLYGDCGVGSHADVLRCNFGSSFLRASLKR